MRDGLPGGALRAHFGLIQAFSCRRNRRTRSVFSFSQTCLPAARAEWHDIIVSGCADSEHRRWPALPDLPDLPDPPDLPGLPDLPDLPGLPDLPDLPDLRLTPPSGLLIIQRAAL